MAGTWGYPASARRTAAAHVQERIQEHDHQVIGRVRELRHAGLSYRRIADLLTRDGLPGPGVGYQAAGKWNQVAVKRICDRYGISWRAMREGT